MNGAVDQVPGTFGQCLAMALPFRRMRAVSTLCLRKDYTEALASVYSDRIARASKACLHAVVGQALTSLAHDPAIRKLPGKVGGLKDRHPMLSSGEDVTSISWGGKVRVEMHTPSP